MSSLLNQQYKGMDKTKHPTNPPLLTDNTLAAMLYNLIFESLSKKPTYFLRLTSTQKSKFKDKNPNNRLFREYLRILAKPNFFIKAEKFLRMS